VLASGALFLASYLWEGARQVLPVAGLMAPQTALTFLLLGLALLAVDRRDALAQWLALVAGLLPMVALTGYAFQEHRFYRFQNVGMALHTALGLLLLGLGTLTLRPERGPMRTVMDTGAGGVLARRMLPLVLLPLGLGALVRAGIRSGVLDEGLGWPLFIIMTMVASAALLWRSAMHLNALHARERKATERARADAERQATLAAENARLYRDAESAARQREDVLAIVSHDLKSPLSSVRLSAELMRRRLATLPGAEGLHKQVDAIERATRQMEGLITRVLDAARLDAGQALAIERHPEPLRPLLTEALALIEPQASAKALHLERHLTLEVEVPCDRERLLQVLGNLLANAVKFTPEGGTIRVEAEREANGVRVAVRDTGPGIPEAARAHLFERHWQATGQDARLGSGLGLYIARGIIDAHGGRLWVESTVGKGSTFAFTLPLDA
jgi:signal transduction histidine kinase